ncbi:MAG: hypothetical protein K9J12_11825 [Melioribacteraceae bacterium]|nr:hypothetical protein [Melioribacteraceae bacterium]MCF8264060.1 hypothetical protein [Melioribacteraceae bacterium]MCF8411872.1 hypothetical protein [Melioribacteraceae bacterium]MCF8432236.1 hypothetical protein [Melioribacteraceae bacterium]
MKSNIFNHAIARRQRIRFLYGLQEFLIEPYYVATNGTGKKVIYGRVNNGNQIKMFEFEKIANIKVLDKNRFSPLIPILPIAN